MQIPPLCHDEPIRLAELHATGQLESPKEERFEILTRMAQRVLDVPIVAISLVDADQQWFKSIVGLDVCSTSRDISFCGHAILSDQIMEVPDVRDDPRFADNPLVTGPPHLVYYAAHPICSASGSNIATFCILDTKSRLMSPDDRATLRDLALMAQQQLELTRQRSVQIDLINRLEIEKRRAMVDPLTRLWNRRGLDELLHAEIQLAEAANTGVAIILADLDRFKEVNDHLGHTVGDEVLREVARRLLSSSRQTDSVGRYGGEEFLIILSNCPSASVATQAAERMREHLAASPISTSAGDQEITASFGVCFAPTMRESDAKHIIELADHALYAAKANGRNRVHTHHDQSAAA